MIRTSRQLEYAQQLRQPKNLLTNTIDKNKYEKIVDTISTSEQSKTKKLKKLSNQHVEIQIGEMKLKLTK